MICRRTFTPTFELTSQIWLLFIMSSLPGFSTGDEKTKLMLKHDVPKARLQFSRCGVFTYIDAYSDNQIPDHFNI